MWGLPPCSKGGIGSNVKSVIGINVAWPPRVEISMFCLRCLHRAVWWEFYSLDLTFWLLARKIRFIKNKLFICWACVKVFICGHRQRKLSFPFHFWKERGITFPDSAPDHPVCCWHLYFGQFKVTLLLLCSNCAFLDVWVPALSLVGVGPGASDGEQSRGRASGHLQFREVSTFFFF